MNTLYKSILLAMTVLIIACKSDSEMSPEAEVVSIESPTISITKKQFDASEMANGQIQKKQFDKTITVNGKIKLPNKSKAIVSSIISGTVGSIDLLEGQWIQKGQALFTLTNPELIDLQEEYLVLQSKIDYLREEELRKQKLVSENLSPNQELLLAKSEYLSNQARYKTISKKLKMYGVDVQKLSIDNLSSAITIYSPISGYVSHINALRGQYIEPSTEIVEVENKSNIYLALNVMERDASLITIGQSISFTVTRSATSTYDATVQLINPSVNEHGMVIVHCRIKDPKGLLPGMYTTANMILKSYTSNAIPEDAIVQIDGKDHILLLSANNNDEITYLPTEVEIGTTKNGYVELLNSDNIIDKDILTKGGYYLVN